LQRGEVRLIRGKWQDSKPVIPRRIGGSTLGTMSHFQRTGNRGNRQGRRSKKKIKRRKTDLETERGLTGATGTRKSIASIGRGRSENFRIGRKGGLKKGLGGKGRKHLGQTSSSDNSQKEEMKKKVSRDGSK